MSEAWRAAAEIRKLQQSLFGAEDEQIKRVVAIVDALAERGAADRLIAPLRPRLAQLRPARPLRFCRLLFLPLDPLIVPAPKWRPMSLTIPRTVLEPLAVSVLDAMRPDARAAVEAVIAGSHDARHRDGAQGRCSALAGRGQNSVRRARLTNLAHDRIAGCRTPGARARRRRGHHARGHVAGAGRCAPERGRSRREPVRGAASKRRALWTRDGQPRDDPCSSIVCRKPAPRCGLQRRGRDWAMRRGVKRRIAR